MEPEATKRNLQNLIDKLDTLDNQKAWGEIVVYLIESNIVVSEKMRELIVTIDRSSKEATKINKGIMYLTVALAASAFVVFVKDLSEMIKPLIHF
jgi:hypothetical protein